MKKYVKIKELGRVITGKTPSTTEPDNFDGIFPFITPTDIKSFDEKYLLETERTISEKGAKKLKSIKLPKDSICFVCIGSTIGKMCLTNMDSFSNQQINSLITDEHYDSHYIFYLLRYIKGYFQQLGAGSGSGKGIVNKSTFERTKILVENNKDNQEKIASILSAYDELIENNNKRIKILEQMAENLYKEWFVRFRFPGYETAEFENGIPKGWKAKKLFDVANVKYGYAFKSDLFCDDETLKPVVRIRDIPNNKTNTYTSEQCDECYLINENSIVIGMDGIFHMCLWNGGRAFLNQRVVEIESKYDNLNNLHLYYILYPQVKYWEQTISGTTVAHLGDKHLKKMSVILPSEDICKKTNDFFNNIMLQKNKLFKQNENLIKQRDLLLPRLMSGKLEV